MEKEGRGWEGRERRGQKGVVWKEGKGGEGSERWVRK